MVIIQYDETKLICRDCIGDEFLANEVKLRGAVRQCNYCGERGKTLTLEDVADRVHTALSEHFYLTPDYMSEPEDFVQWAISHEWERRGDPVECVISDVAGVSEEIACDVRELLSDKHGHWTFIRKGGEDPYNSEAMYEERDPSSGEFLYTWDEFCRGIRSRARFFSNEAKENLSYIFGDLTALESFDGRTVIREIDSASKDRFIWRSRQAGSDEELKTILKSPAQEIGPPPPSLAKSGRMNAAGISVFYGAMEKATCVAEVRPPVGSYVVVGKFEVLKPLKLLDLGVLTEVIAKGSYFDPGYAVRKSRVAFLRQLVDEISRPVMPGDEQLEYIATQVVAEYLAQKPAPGLDGIIFHSSQTGGNGRNVVLFHHASEIEPYDLPDGAESDVSIHIDDGHGYIYVSETIPREQSDVDSEETPQNNSGGGIGKPRSGAVLFGFDDDESVAAPPGEPTLRLDLDSVVVLKIKGVKYSCDTHNVMRHRGTDEPHIRPRLVEDLPFI